MIWCFGVSAEGLRLTGHTYLKPESVLFGRAETGWIGVCDPRIPKYPENAVGQMQGDDAAKMHLNNRNRDPHKEPFTDTSRKTYVRYKQLFSVRFERRKENK